MRSFPKEKGYNLGVLYTTPSPYQLKGFKVEDNGLGYYKSLENCCQSEWTRQDKMGLWPDSISGSSRSATLLFRLRKKARDCVTHAWAYRVISPLTLLDFEDAGLGSSPCSTMLTGWAFGQPMQSYSYFLLFKMENMYSVICLNVQSQSSRFFRDNSWEVIFRLWKLSFSKDHKTTSWLPVSGRQLLL